MECCILVRSSCIAVWSAHAHSTRFVVLIMAHHLGQSDSLWLFRLKHLVVPTSAPFADPVPSASSCPSGLRLRPAWSSVLCSPDTCPAWSCNPSCSLVELMSVPINVCSLGLTNLELSVGIRHGKLHRFIKYTLKDQIGSFDLAQDEHMQLLQKTLVTTTKLEHWGDQTCLVVDARYLYDSGHDRQLRKHTGTHLKTLESLSKLPVLQQVLEDVPAFVRKCRKSRQMAWIFILCIAGRHCSVALATFVWYWLCSFADIEPTLTHLSRGCWEHLCGQVGCSECELDKRHDVHLDRVAAMLDSCWRALSSQHKRRSPASASPSDAAPSPPSKQARQDARAEIDEEQSEEESHEVDDPIAPSSGRRPSPKGTHVKHADVSESARRAQPSSGAASSTSKARRARGVAPSSSSGKRRSCEDDSRSSPTRPPIDSNVEGTSSSEQDQILTGILQAPWACCPDNG